MEYDYQPIDQVSENLHLHDQNLALQGSPAGWGVFLAIVGFIFVGIMVFIALIMGTLLSSFNDLGNGADLPFPPAILSLFYLVVAVLYFIPIWYLYQFSTRMKRALKENDQADLDRSISNLHALFRFSGILTIIILVLYGLGIFAGIIFAGSLASLSI